VFISINLLTTSSKQKKSCQEFKMNEMIETAPGLPCNLPFIVSSNIDKADPATRKLIRRHVMHGRKRKRVNRPKAAGLATTELVERRGNSVSLPELIYMYTLVQPSYFDKTVNFPSEIEASVCRNMEQGTWHTGRL
jgi:hypothetical protein